MVEKDGRKTRQQTRNRSETKINKKKDYNKNKIFNLRKKRIKYVNKSLDQTIMQILKICKKI